MENNNDTNLEYNYNNELQENYKKINKAYNLSRFTNFILCITLGVTIWQSGILHRILPMTMDLSVEQKISTIHDYLDEYYVEELDKEMMEEGLYAGIVAGVQDPYTYYLTADDVRRYLESNNGHFVGIGIEVMKDENYDTVIMKTYDYNPAYEAGILAGDIIKFVDGVDVSEMELLEVTTLIKGEIGKIVDITILRDDEFIDFTIELEDIVTKTIEYRMMDTRVGYIKISGFKENTYEQFMIALRNLQMQEMEGLIIDLRDNLGGLVNSVYEIAEELLPAGVLVGTVDKNGKNEDLVLDNKYLDIPMVVLVNENSASASEIFAGAAKDTGTATIVGTQTFGKGLVQGLYSLPDGSALNITIKKYSTPSGEYIHGKGITPDVVVEMTDDYIEGTDEQYDHQLESGIAILYDKLN